MWQGTNGCVQNPIELAATQYLIVNSRENRSGLRIGNCRSFPVTILHQPQIRITRLAFPDMPRISLGFARVLASLIQRPFWKRTAVRFSEILDQLAHSCAPLKQRMY